MNNTSFSEFIYPKIFNVLNCTLLLLITELYKLLASTVFRVRYSNFLESVTQKVQPQSLYKDTSLQKCWNSKLYFLCYLTNAERHTERQKVQPTSLC